MGSRVAGVGAAIICSVAATVACGLEADGSFRSLQGDTLVVFANGRERRLLIDQAATFLDAHGRPLSDGIRAAGFVPDAEITITVEFENGRPVLKQLQLGHRPIGPRATAGGARGDQSRALLGRPSTGLVPLLQMTAEDRYEGEDGGLYGGGRNEPPEPHARRAKAAFAQVVPRDKEGKPDAAGTIGFISVSMSNATQEFSAFKRLADMDPAKSRQLTIVDCAQGGQTMARWTEPEGRCWAEAFRRLDAAGVSPAQVQVAWVKLANAGPSGSLEQHGRQLERDTIATLRLLRQRFPSLQVAYLGSRIYGGYASTLLNPEPFAYEGGFVVRWVIQDQIRGMPELNADPDRGEQVAPVLLWGPYLWADGRNGRRQDDLVYLPEDFARDGTHPSAAGVDKIAREMLRFFKTDRFTGGWFAGP